MDNKKNLNYCDLPEEFSNKETSSICILPVPYDGTSTWQKGAWKGPNAIIDVSKHMEFYDIETDSEVFRLGIHTETPLPQSIMKGPPEKMVEEVKKRTSKIIKAEKFPVIIGGEHSVSIGAIQSMADVYHDLTILQLDAHSDLRQEYEGSSFNHACVMARALEVCPAVQVGIRSMDREEKDFYEHPAYQGHPSAIFYAHKLKPGWQKEAVEHLSEHVYVTIDLDVFDPSLMPATGTPEPGGLQWQEVQDLLTEVTQKKRVVGFDVVELCPGINPAPDFLAAKLIYTFLSKIFFTRS